MKLMVHCTIFQLQYIERNTLILESLSYETYTLVDTNNILTSVKMKAGQTPSSIVFYE